MLQSAWDEIERVYTLPHVEQATIELFKALKSSQDNHTKRDAQKGEVRSPHHYCSFFLPIDRNKHKIYLCHHKKANDWIPPGGHIDPGETPSDAAVREMQEELSTAITKDQLQAWNLSVKPINRPDMGCLTHYDVWHLVDIKEQSFRYDPREYYDGGWFGIAEATAKITQNPDFAHIISQIKFS